MRLCASRKQEDETGNLIGGFMALAPELGGAARASPDSPKMPLKVQITCHLEILDLDFGFRNFDRDHEIL